MRRSALVMGLVLLLTVVLAGGVIFAQPKKPTPKPRPNCSYTVEKDESGNVQYVLKGPDCKAIAGKINEQPVQEVKGKCRGKCVCTLEGDIWFCRGCCPEELLSLL